jgi:NAD dependent epimerase/dehydratase
MTANWKNRKVLVTGAGGFIGSRLCEKLVEAGASVSAFVRYTSRSNPGLLRFIPKQVFNEIAFIRGDLRDFNAVEQSVDGVDTVFHLGALISIPYSYVHPVETVQTNVLGTMNVLEACRKHGAKLVHTSTSEVYGTALRVPIDENHPLQGQSPYSASKIGADKLVESYYRSFNVPVVTVRPFNTYGPGQSNRAVIPTIITQALAGDVVRLGNLSTIRDFTYLDDMVEGFLRAGAADLWDGETYNLGTGEEISIGAVAELIFNIMGKQPEIQVDSNRLRPEKSEVLRLISDNRKAKTKLGWVPRIGMQEGLNRTIDWISVHLDCYQVDDYGV